MGQGARESRGAFLSQVRPARGVPAESDLPSALLQVRDAVVAAGIAGVGLAAVGLIGVMFSRNKRQKQ